MHRSNTRRQRWRLNRRGQVAAVATLFGLLLVVTFIAEFLLAPLPGELTNSEFQHLLSVQNAIGAFEASILVEAAHSSSPLSVTTPVVLGSSPIPPFGPGSPGSITTRAALAGSNSAFTIAQVSDVRINYWNKTFSDPNITCINGGGQAKCHYYNVTENGTQASPASDSVSPRGQAGLEDIVNFWANWTTLTINPRGNAPLSYVVVKGSNDTVVLVKNGKGGGINATFFIYGQNDTVDLSGLTVPGTVAVNFIGQLTNVCPAGNRSSSDSILFPPSSMNGGLALNATWWNFVGYSVPAHTVTAPNGFTYTATYISGFTGCAFTVTKSTTYAIASSSDLVVHLANHYLPATDVVSQEGAVITQQVGGTPVMVSPPAISIQHYPSDLTGVVTLFSFVGSQSSESGNGVAAIVSHLVSVNRFAFIAGSGISFVGGFNITLVTAYPAAWATYFAASPAAFPGGATCRTMGSPSVPVSCSAVPSNGQLVRETAQLSVQSILLTIITVQIDLR